MSLSAAGIVAEFNPFHFGHLSLLRQARLKTNCDVLIILMSGNWVQRGQPAIVDKWVRTWTALSHGADLLIELPVLTAVQPADRFALGAVNLINQLKCSWLVFGCEDPSLDFNRLAKIQVKPKSNYHFSAADLERRAFDRAAGTRVDLPNDLLALNYARAKQRLASRIRLVPMSRKSGITSGMIRRELLNGQFQQVKQQVPDDCDSLFNRSFLDWNRFWPLLRYRLIEAPLCELHRIYQMREGLEYRMKRSAVRSSTFRQFIHSVKTKRYTYSSLQRLCFYVLIDLTESGYRHGIRQSAYLRVLGFNQRGRQYLNQVKKRVSLPIITNSDQTTLHGKLKWEFKAGMLTEMMLHQHEDRFRHPIIDG